MARCHECEHALQAKHTPLPWKLTGEEWDGDGAAGIGIKSEPSCRPFVAFVAECTARGEPCGVSVQDWANAEFIVRACNNHAGLVAAFEFALLAREGRLELHGPSLSDVLEDILAKVKETCNE